jgi:hypothetical protein
VQGGFGAFRPIPAIPFNRLGLTPADGWMPPPGADVQALMPKWLRDHANLFRIQRFVANDAK